MNKTQIHIRRALPFESKCLPSPLSTAKAGDYETCCVSPTKGRIGEYLPKPPSIPTSPIVKPD